MNGVDILHCAVALVVCGLAFSTLVSPWPPDERRIAWYAWWAHVASTFAVVSIYLYYYHGGDLVVYFQKGRYIAAYVEYDYANNLPELFSLLLQRDTRLPLDYLRRGSATGSMIALGGVISLVTSSIWAGSLLVSTAAATGQAYLWLGLRVLLPTERHRQAILAAFLVPSVVFWSSSLLKEALALIGVGMVVHGAAGLTQNSLARGALRLALGASIIGLFKPYVLFPLVAGGGVYFYWSRAAYRGGVRIRPLTFLAATLVAAGVILALGTLFPNFAIDTVADSIEEQQAASSRSEGGSNFRLTTDAPSGVGGLAAQAPYAVTAALFRPFVFESRNILMLINSLETTVILYFLIMALVKTGRIELLRWAWRSPDIMASVMFVLTFSLAVGLATTNLGTLSRYRLPMMPFYFYVVFSANRLPHLAREKAMAVLQTREGARTRAASASSEAS